MQNININFKEEVLSLDLASANQFVDKVNGYSRLFCEEGIDLMILPFRLHHMIDHREYALTPWETYDLVNALKERIAQLEESILLQKCDEAIKRICSIWANALNIRKEIDALAHPLAIGIRQSKLVPKIEAILKKNQPLKKIEIKGLCYGLSLFWGYYQFLGKEHDFFERLKLSIAGRIDKVEDVCHDENERELKRFLEESFYLQEQQNNERIYLTLSQSLQLVSEQPAIQRLSTTLQFASTFLYDKETKNFSTLIDALYSILSAVPQTEKLLLLSIATSELPHAAALFCRNDQLYFYDSNCNNQIPPRKILGGEAKTVESIVKYITHNILCDDDAEHITLSIEVVADAHFQSEWEELENTLYKTFFNFHLGNGNQDPDVMRLVGNSNLLKMAKKLSDAGADFNLATSTGFNALIQASQNGHLELVQLLVENKAAVNVWHPHEATPLIKAIEYGHLHVFNYLLQNHASVKQFAPTKISPLSYAAEKGNFAMVEILLEKNAPVDGFEGGHNPLWRAAQNGYLKIVKALLKKGADVNALDGGCTPLWIASQNGHYKIVETLLNSSAKVEICSDKLGVSPLWIASQNGHYKVVEILLRWGAETEVYTYGKTPLEIAEHYGFNDIANLIKTSKNHKIKFIKEHLSYPVKIY